MSHRQMKKFGQRFSYSELNEIQYSEDEDENINVVSVEENARYLPDLTDTGNLTDRVSVKAPNKYRSRLNSGPT